MQWLWAQVAVGSLSYPQLPASLSASALGFRGERPIAALVAALFAPSKILKQDSLANLFASRLVVTR